MNYRNHPRHSVLQKLALCFLVGGVILVAPPVRAQSLSNVQQDALRAVAAENWSEAVRLYRQAIQLSPQQASLYNNLGVAQRQLGDRAGAIESYRKALELDANFTETYGNLAVLLLLEGEWQEALEVTQQARSLGITDPTISLYFGIASEKTQNWEDAARAYDRYLKTEASAPIAYRAAISFWQAGEGRDAIRAFKRATQLDPAFALYVSETGLALAKVGANRSAIEFLTDLPTDWSNPRDFVVLARLAQQEDMLDLAEASLLRAFQLSQSQGADIPASWVSDAGTIEASKGEVEEAQGTFQNAIDGTYRSESEATEMPSSASDESNSEPQDLFDIVARVESQQPAEEPEEVAVNQSDRDVAIASANLADTYLSQGNYALAFNASQAAIEADSTLPVAYNNRGAALMALGDPVAASDSFLKAIELQPDYWQAQRNLGIAYIQQGDRDRAREYLGEAMSNAPSLELVQQINDEMVTLDRSEINLEETE